MWIAAYRIAGSNGYTQVVRKNLYREVAPELAGELQALGLGELLQEKREVKLAVQYEDLQKAMEGAGLKAEDYFDISVKTKPVTLSAVWHDNNHQGVVKCTQFKRFKSITASLKPSRC